MIQGFARQAVRLATAMTVAVTMTATVSAADTIRVAFGDIASVESLNLLIAFERARERGVDVKPTFFKSEDLAAQAVVGGQADIGIGTPYALLQKVKAPIRMFFQISNLRFYPVVNTEFYKDWKDLDGQEIAVHSRGSGTEAIMNLMAKKNGIKYSRISYVPGAEVRAGALLQGNVKATIVDSASVRLIEEKGGGKFKVLEMGDVAATDEALYANENFLKSHAASVAILVEELIKTQREILANPGVVVALREKYKLLPDLPKDLVAEIGPYFEDAAKAKLYPADGGSSGAVADDFAFYTTAGQLQGEPATLKVEDFWDFGPLDKARSAVNG